jgi:hypothetical protein
MEGQQTIDLDSLNLCAVDYDESTQVEYPTTQVSDISILQDLYSDKELIQLLLTDPEDMPKVVAEMETGENVIIEFSEGTVKNPDPVNYEITVNPGDQVTNDTIIGFVEQDGENKKLKSIFSQGTVKGINDN